MLRPLILAALATVGCVETLPPLDETTSLAVELVAPADPGAPDRRLEVMDVEIDRAGDLWIDTQFTVIRKDKVEMGRYYNSVVSSKPVPRPLRCGEVLLEPLGAPFAPWPQGFDASCQRPLVLLQNQRKWKPGNTYPKYGKAVRGASDVGAPRFVELEIGGKLVLGALADVATDRSSSG